MKKLLTLFCLLAAGLSTPAQVYYTQDFEGAGIPAGWMQTSFATDGGWLFSSNSGVQSSGFPVAPHTKMACTNDDLCNCDKSEDLLYTLSVDLSSAAPQVYMTYANYYFNRTYQGITETAMIVVSTDGGVTWIDTMTVAGNSINNAWQTNLVDLSAYSGDPDVRIGFLYNDGGGWLYGWAIDDIVIKTPPAGVDLSVTYAEVGKLDPRPEFISIYKYLTGLPLDIRVTVFNEALTPITSFDVSWSDGTNTNNQSVTGVNIGPLQQYVFNTSVPYTTLAGAQTVTVTASNVNNGATELSTANNADSAAITGVTPHPDAHFLAEEGTGTWCGWCPRGDLYMHYMKANYGNQFVGLSAHYLGSALPDPMGLPAYTNGLSIPQLPTIKVNRDTIVSTNYLETEYINRIDIAPPAVLSGTAVYNQATSMVTVDLTGMFSQALNGDYQLAAILREDSVHVINPSYNQVNFYANNVNGAMGGLEIQPDTIPSAMMYYDFVARDLFGSFFGAQGSLPASIAAGSTHSYQFTTTPTTIIDENRLFVVGILLDNLTGLALQAVEIPVSVTTGLPETSAQPAVAIYPNPATDLLHIRTVLPSAQSIRLAVTDAMGRVCRTTDFGTVPAGSRVFDLEVSDLAPGIYSLSVETPDSRIVRKFTR